MKKLALALVLLVVAASGANAVAVHMELYDGQNMFALPNAPFEVGHEEPAYGNAFVYNPYYLFGTLTGGPDPSNNLYKIDPTLGSIQKFNNDFNMILGEGYVYSSVGTTSLNYQGVPDGVPDDSNVMTDMLIPLPGRQDDTAVDPNPNPALAGGGWHLIGYPYAHEVWPALAALGDNVFFTDGTVMKDWQTAINDGWVDGQFVGVDSTLGSNIFVKPDDTGDGSFKPGHAYRFRTFKDNIALIIPAAATVPGG